MADFFEDETSFQDFLNEQKLNVLFEIPVLKELSKTENLKEVFKSSEKQKLLETIAEKVLDKVFRIK
jgi:ATP-binding protein involved in chromosome partitioning